MSQEHAEVTPEGSRGCPEEDTSRFCGEDAAPQEAQEGAS